jgi:hypothetical protein
MALSNWLTREEWNTAYFAGVVNADENSHGLGDLLIAGMVAMHKAGYIFTGINIDDNGNYNKITQCCGDNAGVLVELMDGSFNAMERAKSAVAYADVHIPNLDLSAIKSAINNSEKE